MPRNKRRNQRRQQSQPKIDNRIEPGYIPDDFIAYYKNQFVPNLLSEEEFESFISTYRTTLPHVFRLPVDSLDFQQVRKELEEHIKKLKELGFDASIIDYIDPSYGLICKLSVSRPEMKKNESLHPFRDWLHMHTVVGDITRQEFVSMLPPLFLNVEPNHKVVDMCAAPGSKTMQILEKLNNVTDKTHLISNEGFIVANDIDLKRCNTLVHQLNRINTSKVLVISHPAQYIPDLGVQFDRVLCDVPCSGDGTFRKNPDATKKWNVRKGCGQHSIQRSILIRGLQMLKVGGICVYSTCSLNPIEDEAVINSVLQEISKSSKKSDGEDPVSIVDCSKIFPGLIRSNGMKTWQVYYDNDVKYDKYSDVIEDHQKSIKETMFPVDVTESISRCMRFFPHQNDTGGFFVTVLQKNSEFDVKVQNTQNSLPKNLKEPAFVPLKEVETGDEIIQSIVNDYGINDAESTFSKNLFAKTEKTVKTIYYLSDQVADVVKKVPSKVLRPVSCGTRIFTFKSLSSDGAVNAFPCFEGIDILDKFATKRIVSLSPADLKSTLKAGNDGFQFSSMSQKSAASLKELPIGGLIIKCEGTNFIYGGMKRSSNLTLQVKKERIMSEIRKIVNFFPELAEKDDQINSDADLSGNDANLNDNDDE